MEMVDESIVMVYKVRATLNGLLDHCIGLLDHYNGLL